MEKIIDSGNKVDFHIHSIASKHKESDDCVDLSTIENIDILINNAGIAQDKMFIDITDQDWNNMLQVNLTSMFYTIQEVLPTMIHNKNGCIINISSIWGLVRSIL